MKPVLALLAGVIITVGCGPSDGPHTAYHENENKKEEGFYKNGEKTGKWTYYWKHGSRQVEGTYRNGKQEGIWIFYNKGAALNLRKRVAKKAPNPDHTTD